MANLYAPTSVAGGVLFGEELAAGEQTILTVAPGLNVVLATGVVANLTGAAVAFGLSLVPAGGNATHARVVPASYTVPANDALPLRDFIGGALLGPGDFISAYAAGATELSLVLTGMTIT